MLALAPAAPPLLRSIEPPRRGVFVVSMFATDRTRTLRNVARPRHPAPRPPAPTCGAGSHRVIPIVSIVGKSDSGKTTLLEKLIPELKKRGAIVATVKHDVHGFDIDVPGKDTWRHAQAGADIVFIANSRKTAMINKVKHDLSLDEIAELADGADILITEGYKRADKPKIEVSRKARSSELICSADELVAVVTDQQFDVDVPLFDLDDATGLADLIESKFLAKKVAGG